MCQRLNTGESNNFYFGIFTCIGPLRKGVVVLERCSEAVLKTRGLLAYW